MRTRNSVTAPARIPAPVLVLPHGARRELIEHARRSLPFEACGVLLGRRRAGLARVTRVLAGPNVHPHPESGFELDPGFLVRLLRRHRAPVGFWHSHPRAAAWPSRADLRGHWPDASCLIVGLGGPRPRLASFRPGESPDGWVPEVLRVAGRARARTRNEVFST